MTSPLEQSERAGRLSFPTFRFFGHEPRTTGPAEKANLASREMTGNQPGSTNKRKRKRKASTPSYVQKSGVPMVDRSGADRPNAEWCGEIEVYFQRSVAHL